MDDLLQRAGRLLEDCQRFRPFGGTLQGRIIAWRRDLLAHTKETQVESDLRNFIQAFKDYMASQSFGGLVVLLAAGGKLVADIAAVLTPKAGAVKLESCPLPTSLADVVPALEAEASVSAIDWAKVLQIIITALRLLIG